MRACWVHPSGHPSRGLGTECMSEVPHGACCDAVHWGGVQVGCGLAGTGHARCCRMLMSEGGRERRWERWTGQEGVTGNRAATLHLWGIN